MTQSSSVVSSVPRGTGPRSLVVGGPAGGGAGHRSARPARSSSRDDPTRARARDRRRLGRAGVGHRPLLRPVLQPVRDAAARAGQRPGAEPEHDRRGARFELVHQPHRGPRADGRRGRCAARCTGPAPAPATVDHHAREERGRGAPGFTAQDASGQTWFVSFDAPANPEGATGARGRRHEDLLGARLQPGRVLPDRDAARDDRDRPRARPGGARPASARR